jgi:hypothetical protein
MNELTHFDLVAIGGGFARLCAAMRGAELGLRRRCSKLARYGSQSENPRFRAIRKSQKIRIRLGGTTNLLDPFPDKPRNMQWRTYGWLFNQAEATQELWVALSRDFLRLQNLRSQPVERRSSSQ